MKNWSIVSLLVMLMGSVAFGYTTSDYTWLSYGGHNYALTIDYGNWEDAEAEALAIGAHLVTINTAEENAWIVANFDILSVLFLLVVLDGYPFLYYKQKKDL